MSWTLPPDVLNALLSGLHEAQLALRALLHALGLTAEVQGQPAWPFAWRLAGELLTREPGHARRVALSLACVALALGLLLAALGWRRRRGGLLVASLLPLLLAPWPEAHLLFAPAWPTSFHQSPTGFSAQAIVQGQAVYRQHCLRCHGADGGGEGPDAARGPMWPPTLNGALLWRRLDGELFHHVRQGLRARDGTVTMPGFAGALTEAQVWAVLDFLQANASGRTLQEAGAWAYPVRLPALALQCRQGQRPSVREFQGQRLRLVMAGPKQALPEDDPRLVNVVLPVGGRSLAGADPECRITDDAAPRALALLLGVPEQALGGYELLADRTGWLRARGLPGRSAWSENDLVCRAGGAAPAPTAAPGGGGLEGLIRRMDAEPVRLLRGGFPHG